MKTIGERAENYVSKDFNMCLQLDLVDEQEIYRDDVKEAFIAGAQSEYTELTRWHDPNVELPPNGWEVLCDIDCCSNNYAVLRHYDNGWMMYTPGSCWCDCPFKVIGWRGINE